MIPDSASLLAFLINSAIQVAIIAAGTSAALRLARNATASMKCRIAVVGLTLCGVVPMIAAWPVARLNNLAIVAAPVNTNTIANSGTVSLVVCGYFALVLWHVARLIRATIASVGLRRSSVTITDGPIVDAFHRCNVALLDIPVCRSPRVTTPLVCGVARPAIVFPDDFAESDSDLIDAVLAHECAHVARKDLAVTIAVQALTVAFAVHPAVAALKRVAATHREVACDELAIAALRLPRSKYAWLLLRIAGWQANVGRRIAHGAATHLEARIHDLLEARPARCITLASQALVYLCLVTATAIAPLATVAVDAPWRELSGAWTLDVDESQPRDDLPLRAARLRIDATSDRVHIAQQRTRGDGVREAYEIRRTTDDVPSEVSLPGGMVMRTRARWDGVRLVTNSSALDGRWRERLETFATGNRLVIKAERTTGRVSSRHEFVFHRD